MPTILIVGATGQQGGAVVKALQAYIRSDVTLRALSRNLQSPAATKPRKQGVEVFKADLEDPVSIEVALRGCDAAYLVTDLRGPGDVKGEVEQGRQFADAVKRADVPRVVFSSVSGCKAPEVEHFHTKYQIEQYIRQSGLSWTFIRPVGFMDLIPPPGISRAFFLSSTSSVSGSVKQKLISCEDIGKAVARVLMEPQEFNEKTYEIVGEVATVSDVRDALARGEGTVQGWIVWVPQALVLALTPYHYKQMFTWLNKGLQPGDLQTTKEIVPDVLDIEVWASRKRNHN